MRHRRLQTPFNGITGKRDRPLGAAYPARMQATAPFADPFPFHLPAKDPTFQSLKSP